MPTTCGRLGNVVADVSPGTKIPAANSGTAKSNLGTATAVAPLRLNASACLPGDRNATAGERQLIRGISLLSKRIAYVRAFFRCVYARDHRCHPNVVVTER